MENPLFRLARLNAGILRKRQWFTVLKPFGINDSDCTCSEVDSIWAQYLF